MRVLRRVLQILLVIATLAVGAAAAAILISQTAWFKDWLRGVIVRQADAYLQGQLSIGRIGGNLFFGLEVEDLGVTQAGERVIAVRNVGVDYSVAQLVSGNINIDAIRLDQPRITLRRENGRWNLASLVKRQAQEKERSGPGRSVSIGEIGISDGRFVIQQDGPVGTSGGAPVPETVDRVDARMSFSYEPVRYSLDIAHLSFRSRSPEFRLNALSGRIAQRDDNLYIEDLAVRTAESSLKVDGEVADYLGTPRLAVTATSDKFDIPEFAALVPALRGIPLQPSFRVAAKGPLNALGLDFSMRSSAGDVSGAVTADLEGTNRRVRGRAQMQALNLAPILKNAEARSRLTGQAQFDLALPAGDERPLAGSYRVQASEVKIAGYEARDVNAQGRVAGNRVVVSSGRAQAYGGRATTSGFVETGVRGPDGKPGLRMDLQGEVAGLDLRNLPRALKVPPLESRLNLSYRVAGVGSALTGEARLEPSSLLGATFGRGTQARFSTADGRVQYEAAGSVQDLDLRRVGRAFKIAALSTDRFTSGINGPFEVRGEGTEVAAMTLDATATLEDSSIAGVHSPSMAVEARLSGGAARFSARGNFAGLDPSRFTEKPNMKGTVAGFLDAEGELADLAGGVTADSVKAAGTVSLGPSKVGELSIDRAEVTGEYAASVGRVQKLEVAGLDLKATASGTVSLDTTTPSDMTYHVESSSLEAVGKVIGTPLQGSATVDGKLTGNRSELATSGTLKGSNLAYGGFETLTAESRFEAKVPDLAVDKATVRAESTLGFVKVGGQEITKLGATTTYTEKQVAFDATAQAQGRNARTVGTLVLHTDHQEVHLTDFGFETQGVRWTLPTGVEPTVQYGGGTITVKQLQLVSGPQSIVAEGFIGEKESSLRAALNDLDIARLDTWVVGERRLGGVLNAGMTVTGPRADLKVGGDFAIDNGAFREFRYETLGGNVSYTGDTLTMDIRLQQGPEAWLTAKGTLPLAFFKAGGGGAEGGAPVDVAIDSSPIDLGLVQGFTGAITEARGVLQAKVRMTGTAADPHLEGGVSVTNGAFTVPASGVSYTGLNGRVDLARDRAVINAMSVTDEHGNTMQFSGDLAVHAREIGQVNLKVDSRKFELLHNDLGHIIVNTDLRVGGELRAPRVEGEVNLDRGDLSLDKILEMASSSAADAAPEPRAVGEGLQPAPTGAGGATQPSPTTGGLPAPRADRRPSGAGGVPPLPSTAGKPLPAERRAEAAKPPAPKGGLFDAATLNVRVQVPDDLVIKGQDIRPATNTPIGLGNVNVTLGGDVRVEKAAGQPIRFLGQVNTVRGTYDFQGRRFEIQRDGRVRLEGNVPIDPALDITATRVISGVEARVHVGGTARKPDLTLTSRPPLEEADILSLIIFNQPANQLGEGQQVSLAQRASALATGFVASKLAESLGDALDLDVFEIQTTPESGTGTGASVTLGEQVGQRLFFRITQGLGADNVSQFVVDYQLTDFLRFETTMSQGGTATRSLLRRVERSGVDLIFFFSY